MSENDYDVVIVGAGNAAACAAMAAQDSGAKKITMLECAPEDEAGGNTRFTAGAMRVVYDGVEDIKKLVDLSNKELADTDFGTYTQDQFYDDIFRVTEYRTDQEMAESLVTKSLDTLIWMKEKGIKFVPIYGRQAFKIDGKFKFWGGLTVETWGGGPGLYDSQQEITKNLGIETKFETRAVELVMEGSRVAGVKIKKNGQIRIIKAKSVIIASGGFQANPEWRTRYLGPGWDLAKIRGTRFNTGDGIRMGIEAGAATYGNWSGCHAVGWDRNAPEFGDLGVGDQFQKHSYPFFIMVNATGKRFVDEGADFRNYTYAKYGRVILQQPNQFAWQVLDAKVAHLKRDEYSIRQVTKVTADTIEELAGKLEGVDKDTFLAEVNEYNSAVKQDIPYNPNVKDGRCTEGLAINKSNWAMTIDTPPFEAYQITCGITFTFGGLRINQNGEVVDGDLKSIPGLYAAGECVGGLFYFNYPGGSGLTAGSVFGKIAGHSAGAHSI